jgi:oligopeptide transport system ATP-binding protein
MQPVVSIQSLRTYFKRDTGIVKAVDDVSLDIAPGEVLGVVGESGSGKSVLSLSMMRLVPTPPAFFPSGKVMFEGQNVLALSEKQLEDIRGNRIAMVFQDPMTSLNPYLTVERQLTEVLERHKGCKRPLARAKAIAMLERVGIAQPQQRIFDYPHQFSGGMRQRVMIAMALLCEPTLLIADEPTTALDVTVQAQILDLLKNLKKDFNTSIVLITHDLGVVAGMADRIAVMYAGKVVEHAETHALYREPSHPYTQGLLQSIPQLENDPRDPLKPIPGLPPDLSALPTGCAFAPRCSLVHQRCLHMYPNKHTVENNHWAACHTLHPQEEHT